jgi:hypothetical protein
MKKKRTTSLGLSLLDNGALLSNGHLLFDNNFLPNSLKTPLVVNIQETKYIIDKTFDEITDGEWLVNIEDKISIKTLERILVKRLRVSFGDLKMPFDCGINDIKVLGKVIMVCK